MKCSHFNWKLSGFHHCHTPFAPNTRGRAHNLQHYIPASPHLGALSLVQTLGGVFWKGKVWLSMTSTAFPELPAHLLHTAKTRTGCDGLSSKEQLGITHGTNSAAVPQAELLLTENRSVWGHWESGLLSKNHEVSKTQWAGTAQA